MRMTVLEINEECIWRIQYCYQNKKKLDALIMNFDDDNIWMNAWNKNLLWYAIYSLYCDLSVMKLFQPIIQREVDKDK